MGKRRGRPHTLSSPVAMFTIIEREQYEALRLLAFRSRWSANFWLRVLIDLKRSGRQPRHFFFRKVRTPKGRATVICEHTLTAVSRILPPTRNVWEAPVRAAIVRYLTAA